ncbi:MAG: TIM barrel protein [Luteitalea sp.]|nr:TIM barrel protein [Luteitalea sp.]
MAKHETHATLSRRSFVKTAVWSSTTVGLGTVGLPAWSDAACVNDGATIPLKIGHRAASMKMVGNLGVFKLARQIPGLSGVELQVAAGQPNLRDWDTVRRYKQEAHRWGMMVPSLAGVWDRGVSIKSATAKANLTQSIRAAEMLGASVLLIAFFGDHAPDMNDEASFAPVVELLKDVARPAADAGVILGLESSLSPAENVRLVDLVDSPNVKVYYDIHNMAHYGYGDQAVPGIELLGKERICMVHVKNEDRLIEERGKVDWRAAFETLNEIGYSGWYVFESQHTDQCQLVDTTTRNIQFLKKVCRMPPADAAVASMIKLEARVAPSPPTWLLPDR